MPRLFVALDLPDRVTDQLASLQDEELDVKWVVPNKIHLTLRFLGDVDASRVGAINEALGQIDAPGFEVTPKGLGVFPSHRSPSVLWVGLRNNPALHELQQQVEEAVVELGFDPENRSFTPHLTIARCKHTDPEKVRSFMKAHGDFSAPSFTCDTFYLYESELHPEGARYTKRGSYDLAPVP